MLVDGWTLILEWLALGVRWIHIITAIAWIGSSFYFIALDLGLWPRDNLPEGAHGEAWQVHGGGFYHIQKYLVAPKSMPEHLTWFKWESYMTWISGFALLAIVYYANAELIMVDRALANLSSWQAIGLSIISLSLGWVLYNRLCKLFLGRSDTWLMVLLFIALIIISYAYTLIFTGRAAFIHLGALTATIMTANVAMIIIPNQRIVVADLIAGRTPDSMYGKIAKQRSTHNNYLTLPVLFFMLSNHYPLAFASEWNWVIASLIFLIGVLVRHYYNSHHARRGEPMWALVLSGIIFVIIIWLSSLQPSAKEDAQSSSVTPSSSELAYLQAESFKAVHETIINRCSMCHSDEPVYEGFIHGPKGVNLDTKVNIAAYAKDIYIQSAITKAMPPGNITHMTKAERKLIKNWYESQAKWLVKVQ